MAPVIKNIDDWNDYILVPVPLGRKKLLYRGYNQSELLVKRLARLMGIESSSVLTRVDDNRPSQASLEKTQRARNIRGAFRVVSNTSVKDKIILVDDVITTGATIEEAAKVLKRAGAKRVIALSFALG
jgi:ComF family protein